MSRRERNILIVCICPFLVVLAILFGLYVYFLSHMHLAGV